ncbi:hypothetical protein, partial [Aeromonas caviae]|uniref:hypothetical protein n=1 Tax=Aeromonas caviae TaxID=648 RepID=UPI002B498901
SAQRRCRRELAVQTLVGKGGKRARALRPGWIRHGKTEPRAPFLWVTKSALPQTGLLPQVDNDAALPVHNVVAVVSWRYKPLLAKEREEREGAASGMDTVLKSGASGSVFIGEYKCITAGRFITTGG